MQHKETIIRIVRKLQFAGVCSLSATTRCDCTLVPFATDDFSLILHVELLGRNVKMELGWHCPHARLRNVEKKWVELSGRRTTQH